MLDILFIAFNRLEMTRESFYALAVNTDWEPVHRLYVHDDGSKDGTYEWLRENQGLIPVPVVLHRLHFGGPVEATNWYLSESADDVTSGLVDRFCKIDNDFVVCPGWLPEVLAQMTLNANVDVFGFEPMQGPATLPPYEKRVLRMARHIGGKMIVRHRIFDHCRPTADGRDGWTQFQTHHVMIPKAWVEPDLPCFGLDQLDFEPWASLTTEYEAKGWARRWPAYPPEFEAYWSWWKPAFP